MPGRAGRDRKTLVRNHGTVARNRKTLVDDRNTVAGHRKPVAIDRGAVIGDRKTVARNHGAAIDNPKTVALNRGAVIGHRETVTRSRNPVVHDRATVTMRFEQHLPDGVRPLFLLRHHPWTLHPFNLVDVPQGAMKLRCIGAHEHRSGSTSCMTKCTCAAPLANS